MASNSSESATVVQFTCSGTDVCTASETMAVMFSALADCIWVPNTSAGSSDWLVALKSAPLWNLTTLSP
jgi:hypothetical protein